MMFRSIKVKIHCDANVDSSDGFEVVQSNLKVMMLRFTVLWARYSTIRTIYRMHCDANDDSSDGFKTL